jgi:hypothetical protein
MQEDHQGEVPTAHHTVMWAVSKGRGGSEGSQRGPGFFPEEVIHLLVEREAKSAR